MNPFEGEEFFLDKAVETRKKMNGVMNVVPVSCTQVHTTYYGHKKKCWEESKREKMCDDCGHGTPEIARMYANLVLKYEKKAAELAVNE